MSKQAFEDFVTGKAKESKPLTKEEFRALMEGFLEWVKFAPGRPDEHIGCWCPACRPEIWGKK